MIAQVRTAAHSSVDLEITVQATKVMTRGSGSKRERIAQVITLYRTRYLGTSSATGQLTARVIVDYRPKKRTAARLSVSASHGCAGASWADTLTVMPARA